jgi:hypothetical protein
MEVLLLTNWCKIAVLSFDLRNFDLVLAARRGSCLLFSGEKSSLLHGFYEISSFSDRRGGEMPQATARILHNLVQNCLILRSKAQNWTVLFS